MIREVDDDPALARALAEMLIDGFRDVAPHAWPEMAAATAEVRASLEPERISLVAIDDDGGPVGWIGGITTYHGHVMELHPLVVRAGARGKGIGRALVAELERRSADRGVGTITVGTDDEMGMTSLGGADLFPDPLRHLASIRDLKGHPFGFYLAVGFSLTGVLPDANGFGKPDIFLSKRVAKVRA